jgi:hypothetical protein
MGENPWKANLTTPTPVIIHEVGPTITITIPVTPSDEQVYEQQKKVADEEWNKTTITVIAGVALLAAVVMGAFVIRYLVGVWRRAKKE